MTTKYQPWTSGNSAGKPPGTKSRKTAAKEARGLLTSTMRDESLSLGIRVQAASALVEQPNAVYGERND